MSAYVYLTRKPCYRKETARCNVFFPIHPMTLTFFRKAKTVTTPALLTWGRTSG